MRKKLQVLIGLLLLAVTLQAANAKFTLVIDAGHGGHDAGAVGSITKEKTINLNVALAFGKLVENNCPDVKVVYTRKADVFVPLHTRADIANRNKADLFISIHTNALPKGRISRGMETYTLGMHRAADNLDVAKRENSVILIEKDYKQRYQGFDPNSSESYIMFEFIQDHNMAQSVELAKFVQQRTCSSAGRQNKGVKQAGFLVLRETSMPSCLIELGFISTPDEEQFLHSSAGVSRLASGIYQAFVDYKQKHHRSSQAAPVKVSVADTPNVLPQEKPREEVKVSKRDSRKSKVMQDLADAREGKATQSTQNLAPNADSIIKATPVVQEKPVVVVQEKPAAVVVQEKPAVVVQEKPAVVVQEKPVAVVQEKPAVVVQEKPAVVVQEKIQEKPAVIQEKPQAPATDAPIFKVQLLAASVQLKANDPQLKGVQNTDYYRENGMFKYTAGASTDYNEINQLRRTLNDRFPQAFVIAFKNGQRVDVHAAIQEYKQRKAKK
jgi:N-acetylmuramoyl-L-alanine amidase